MEKKKRDGFYEFYGITEEEEKFFKFLHRRQMRYVRAITVLLIINAILIVLLYLK